MRPSRTLLSCLGIWMSFSVLPLLLRNMGSTASIWAAPASQLWWLFGAFMLVIACIDASRGSQFSEIKITREVPGSVPVGVLGHIELVIQNPFNHALTLSLNEEMPETLELPDLPLEITLAAHESKHLRTPMIPHQRGLLQFNQLALRVESRLKLWQHFLKAGHTSAVKVYPDFAAIAHLATLGFERGAGQMGVHLLPRRGAGLEFRQLREFREGDTLRQIDWKATARHNKPISREYQDERDQEIIFLLDCGRRLRGKDGPLSHFDQALNALLLTTHVALRQGDAVGFMAFSGKPLWLKPLKGQNSVNLLLKRLYDLECSTQSTDFVQAAQDLMRRHRKRALIVIISNVHEEDKDDLVRAVHLLGKQHRVMIASLQEPSLEQGRAQKVHTFEEALSYSGTTDFLAQRQRCLNELRGKGVIIVDAHPQRLHIHLVQEYLKIKRSGRI